MRLYRRQVELRVARLVVRDLRIRAEIERSVTASQSKAEIWVHNLNPSHADQIGEVERGSHCSLVAGYPETKGLVLDGAVQRSYQGREQLAHVTYIRVGDDVYRRPGDGAAPMGVTSVGYQGLVSTRQIFEQIVTEDLGSSVGDLSIIPAEASTKDFAFIGKSVDALTELLTPWDLNWYPDDGQVSVNRFGGAPSRGAHVLVVSPTRGLIGSPKITDDGVEFRMFLDHRAVPGGVVDLRSRYLSVQGKLATIRHSIDSWSGPFDTWGDIRLASEEDAGQIIDASALLEQIQSGNFPDSM